MKNKLIIRTAKAIWIKSLFFIGGSTLQIRNVWELGIFSSAIQDEQLKSFCAIMSIQNLFTLMPQGPIVIIFPSLFLNKDDNIHKRSSETVE